MATVSWQQCTMGDDLFCSPAMFWWSPRPCRSGFVHSATWLSGSTARSEQCCHISTRSVLLSSLSGPAGDKLCCQVALGCLYARQHYSTCSLRPCSGAALRVSLVSLSLSAPTSSRVPPRGRRGGRAAVSAAASSEPRLALRLLEPRLVCWRAGGRLSLPPPRVSLVSLFVYSSLVSCATQLCCHGCRPARASLVHWPLPVMCGPRPLP